MDRLEDIKRCLCGERKHIEASRQIELIRTLGEPLSMYRVVDSREMTPDLIKAYHMALDPSSDSIRSVIPSSEKVRIRVGPSQYEIRYSYGLRQGVSGPKILPGGRTRAFCENLIGAGKLYSKAEIDRMTNSFGTDAFMFAGGFYTNPETGDTTPFCRHAWFQNIVVRK